jgi:hypothetical protein
VSALSGSAVATEPDQHRGGAAERYRERVALTVAPPLAGPEMVVDSRADDDPRPPGPTDDDPPPSEPRRGEPGQGELRPGEPGPSELRPGEPGPGEPGPSEPGPSELPPSEPRRGLPGPGEPRLAPRRPVTVRLVPLTEPPAQPLRATTPAHTMPPVLGTLEARRLARPPRTTYPGPEAQTSTGPLPDPTPLCCAMVQAAVEGLRGVRPLAQLTRWVSPEVYELLQLRAELVQRAGHPAASHAGIRRIRLFRIGDDVAEASVVVDDGPRVRAVAVRLEGHRGRWRAVVMEIG